MPQDALPWVIAIVLYFGIFLLALSIVVIWCALPSKPQKSPALARGAATGRDSLQA